MLHFKTYVWGGNFQIPTLYCIKILKIQQYKTKKSAFSTKFRVSFTTKIRKIAFSRQDKHQIFSFQHFCDPWGIPNKKTWVSYPGIFFSISVLFGVPCDESKKMFIYEENVRKVKLVQFVNSDGQYQCKICKIDQID